MAYTYRFASILNDRDFAEIELSDVKFDRRIIVPGAFSATINVANEVVAEQARKVIPAKTLVHIYRDSELWGTYIIWQKRVRSTSAGGAQVQLSGASLESWLYRRVIDDDLAFVNTDQIDIMRELINLAQTGWSPYVPSANLGLTISAGLSGVLRDRTYIRTDAASVGQRLEELANVDNGFEYMIKTYIDSATGTRKREIIWGYPEITTNLNLSQFFYPGNIISYEIIYDGTDAATAFWTRGDSVQVDATEDSVPLMTTEPQLATEYLARDWPHLDKVVDYSSVIELQTLEDYAIWWKDNHAGVSVIPQIEVNASDPTYKFSPNQLGSSVIFTITDEYFPLNRGTPTFSDTYRVVGMEVTPPSRGETEKVKLVIATEFDPTGVA